MDVLHERCAGLDVHKDEVVACARTGAGSAVRRIHRRFKTTTRGLLELSDWLAEAGCTHVAMEATGVYWKPVWHVLEGGFQLVLANARAVRNVPGRKTDMNDSTWLADLLAHGLIQGSFVPPEPVQQLRDLTRTRKQLVREVVQHTQRIQKTLEDANIKLSSVLSDTIGQSGRQILTAIIAGESDPAALATLVNYRVRTPQDEIAEALRGRVNDHHRFLLQLHLDQVDALSAAIDKIDRHIEEQLHPFRDAAARLATIPGLSLTAAYVILAEIGPEMSQFPTAAHLVSWAGLCPRMDESAGKIRSTRTRAGNPWLKTTLVQSAWAAARKNGSYLRVQFHRIKIRRGAKKAAVAVAASLLTIAYHLLKSRSDYKDLGANHYDRRDKARTAKRLLKRLADLGFHLQIAAPA
jgi:transposase